MTQTLQNSPHTIEFLATLIAMNPQLIVLATFGILLLAILLEPLATRLRLPISAILVLTGFLGSEAIIALGYDTGLRWWHFHDLIFYVFLPILIFESAFQMDVGLLRRNLPAILTLAIPMMLLSTGIAATLIYIGIGHPSGFPWIAALITGALLSATDPGAVLDLFQRTNAPKRLGLLVDSESLFNDATAIVLFNILVAIAISNIQSENTHSLPWQLASWTFISTFGGGLLAGVIVGFCAAGIMTLIKGAAPRTIVSFAAAYAGFYSAELLSVSGVMAVLMIGLILAATRDKLSQGAELSDIKAVWRFNAYIANAMLFVLSGVTITLAMFSQQWLAMLIGIAAAITARAIGIFTLIPALSALPRIQPISLAYQTVIWWGGVRGAVTLALALSLPAELPYAFTIQSIAYGVVIFTLFIQAPTVGPLLNKLKL